MAKKKAAVKKVVKKKKSSGIRNTKGQRKVPGSGRKKGTPNRSTAQKRVDDARNVYLRQVLDIFDSPKSRRKLAAGLVKVMDAVEQGDRSAIAFVHKMRWDVTGQMAVTESLKLMDIFYDVSGAMTIEEFISWVSDNAGKFTFAPEAIEFFKRNVESRLKLFEERDRSEAARHNVVPFDVARRLVQAVPVVMEKVLAGTTHYADFSTLLFDAWAKVSPEFEDILRAEES